MNDFYFQVDPIIKYPPCIKKGKPQDCLNCKLQDKGGCGSPRALCVKPYKNHKKGCPNYGKKPDCPPNVPMFDEIFDLSKPVFAIVSDYNLFAHTEKMKMKHPNWTETQLLNVLYWQGTARKYLKNNITKFMNEYRIKGYYSTTSPEAMGVDVTATLQKAGLQLEWPARKTVYKVAFAGIPLNDKYLYILK